VGSPGCLAHAADHHLQHQGLELARHRAGGLLPALPRGLAQAWKPWKSSGVTVAARDTVAGPQITTSSACSAPASLSASRIATSRSAPRLPG